MRLELPGLPRSALSLSGRRFNGDLVVNETPPTFGSFDQTHPRRLRLSLRAPLTLGNVIRAVFNDVTLVESDANCSMRS